ncbi:class I SAM-dependent methyltransferase [Bacillus sp. Marseille-P3800]|uniref:class I SAM-dependent methyltransferase n=1 Tax=Bacillus sp. Marseille-P3800 TaxID=2014782 RepID=UPI000C074FF3|nr:class I SAM-dependent methyltransferase [Bacillus sp. Marseille-P3800]
MSSQLPPEHLQQFVGGNFESVGKEFLQLFQQYGHLKPNDHVLDVGSGVGRMALPLSTYLSDKGSYKGFDISKEGVEWAKNNIAATHTNFQFDHVDIYNHLYNPNGTLTSTSFTFPYPDQSFDFIFLTSIFTHLMEEEIAHYLSEIDRVLKEDGTCLFTMFIVNKEAKDCIQAGKSTIQFPFRVGEAFIENETYPNAAVGYDYPQMEGLINETNLQIKEVKLGNWCGRTTYTTYQDLLILNKKKQ